MDELLRYAKFISRTTVPPTLPKQEAGVKEEEEGKVKLANGTGTPGAETQTHDPSTTQQDDGEKANTANANTILLSLDQRDFLTFPPRFEPWPKYMTIQRGALGAIQRLVEAGRDLGGVAGAGEVVEGGSRGVEEAEKGSEREGGVGDSAGGAGASGRRREVVEDVFDPDEM